MSNETLNLWEPFGLRATPYFQDELRTGDREHPVELFVGRDADLKRLVRRIVSDATSRTIVQGEPGVGKTSFINRLKANLGKEGVLTYAHPIRIQTGTTPREFVADALRLLLRVRLAGASGRDEGGFWERTARLLEGGDLRGGSATALGVGAGMTRSYVAPQLPLDSLYEHLGEGLVRLQAEHPRGLLIHVNNLENLTEEDFDEAAALMRDLRDHLLLPGAHWVFVGATGVDEVFRRFAQVDGIFPAAEELSPLTGAEVTRLLERRYQHLKQSRAKVIAPVEPKTAATLYEIYRGDLRSFLRLLGDAAERGLGLSGVRPMTAEEVLLQTRGEYVRHLRSRLGDADLEHLSAIVKAATEPHEFRVTEAARATRMTQASASQLVARLFRARAVRRTRTEGKSVYYRPVGDALVAFGVADLAD